MCNYFQIFFQKLFDATTVFWRRYKNGEPIENGKRYNFKWEQSWKITLYCGKKCRKEINGEITTDTVDTRQRLPSAIRSDVKIRYVCCRKGY